MEKEDYRSFIWQRHYLPAQADAESPLMTWRDAFRYQADELDRVRDESRAAVRTLRRTLDNLEEELDPTVPVALELEAIRTAPAGPAVESEAAPVEVANVSTLMRSTAEVTRSATTTPAWEMFDGDAGGRERSRSPRR